MRLALFEPDNPRNAGTMIRMCACVGVAVDVIDPCGFPFSLQAVRDGLLDYGEKADVTRHVDWAAFAGALKGRLVLLTTQGSVRHDAFAFRPGDVLMVGRETAGVPQAVHDRADARIRVPMRPGLRSLNVAAAAAMVLAEGLRQTDGFPKDTA